MSSETSSQAEVQLTLKDRMDFASVLQAQIQTFQQALLEKEYAEWSSEQAIEGLVNSIPDSWRDPQFRKELKEAETIEQVDNRPVIVPNIRMSLGTCKELGITPYVEEKVVDYYKKYLACINLLDRRGYISKYAFIERLTGKRFQPEFEENGET